MTSTEHGPSNKGGLTAGAGRCTIDLTGILPHDGFDSVADDLAARALVLDGSDSRVVLAVVDLTSLPPRTVSGLKGALARTAATTEDRVIVVASHTFSAPHIHPQDHPGTPELHSRNDEFERRVIDAATRAAATAADAPRAARIETTRAQSRIAVNRDIETAQGWGLGADADGPTDPDASVLIVRSIEGVPMAVLVNCAVQPSVMNGARSAAGGLLVSGDIAGAVCRRLDDMVPGVTAFFLPGAGGDQAPALNGGDASDPRLTVERIAQDLAAEVVRVLPHATVSGDPAALRVERASITVDGQEALPRDRITPTRSHRYAAAGPRDVPIAVLRVGDAQLLCVQPELSVRTGLAIKATSPAEATFIVTMADGAAKYMPEASAYPRFTYEALSSAYAEGSAETLAEAALAMLASGQRA